MTALMVAGLCFVVAVGSAFADAKGWWKPKWRELPMLVFTVAALCYMAAMFWAIAIWVD